MLSSQDRDWFSSSNILLSTRPLYSKARSFHALVTSGPYPVQLTPFQGFTVHGQPLDGLTSQLDLLFHPVPLDISTGGLSTGGSVRGMKIDSQLASLCGGNPRAPSSHFNHFSSSGSQFNSNNIGGAGGFPLLHDYTVRIVKRLRELGLRPFMAQVPVGSVRLRLATALDLVCVDETREGALVNVQIKTGFERRENYSRTQRGAFFTGLGEPPIPDSHEMRHLLQVMAEHLIVQIAYDNPLAYSMLMVVSANLITTRCIPDPTLNIRPADVMRALENRLRIDAPAPVEAEVKAVRARHAARAIKKAIRMNRRRRRK